MCFTLLPNFFIQKNSMLKSRKNFALKKSVKTLTDHRFSYAIVIWKKVFCSNLPLTDDKRFFLDTRIITTTSFPLSMYTKTREPCISWRSTVREERYAFCFFNQFQGIVHIWSMKKNASRKFCDEVIKFVWIFS